MYVLLYCSLNQTCFVQGTIEEINAHVHEACVDGDIDPYDWEFSSPFEMLCIEDGRLTQVNHRDMRAVPHFTVV